MRRGIFGRRELLQLDRRTCETQNSTHVLNPFNLTALKAIHSFEKRRQKGLQYANVSSQTVLTRNSSSIMNESMQELHSPFTYEAAMEALSSLITGKKRELNPNTDAKYKKLEKMTMYVKILGIEEQIADLNIIHVAGTKGKGSTCTFCEAILQETSFKTGLFTSPHLIDVKERFRLNGLEISGEHFLLYFWGCWHQLKENVTEDLPMPPLFQFLTLLGLKIFVSEKVDVAIIEVGLGEKNDSTNVVMHHDWDFFSLVHNQFDYNHFKGSIFKLWHTKIGHFWWKRIKDKQRSYDAIIVWALTLLNNLLFTIAG